jgi:DNA recombination protein RmuC
LELFAPRQLNPHPDPYSDVMTSMPLCFVAGLFTGGAICWIFQSLRSRVELRVLQTRNGVLEGAFTETKNALAATQNQVMDLTCSLSATKADLVNSQNRVQEKARDLDDMQSRLKIEFQNLAAQILDEKTVKFATQNQKNMEQLLDPLRQQIGEFKRKVEDVHTVDIADRAVLRSEIELLRKLNILITEEAQNLTLALKGDSKVQGNWGELILEKVLENSGLTAGGEFTVQTPLKAENGSNMRPDVVIHLPENKHFIVDSKVSLKAYEQYRNAADPEMQAVALTEHVRSVRRHVEELARKKYQDLYQINAPDFVFMFVPIEPAFSSALTEDHDLFNEAFERKVILVTPSTLLATLRTVAQIWKQEKQTRNALEIARRSGALYDKFVRLYDDLIEIGSKLNATTDAYQSALSKLKSGRGNLIKSVDDLKKLGARTSKDLPPVLVQEAIEGDLAE